MQTFSITWYIRGTMAQVDRIVARFKSMESAERYAGIYRPPDLRQDVPLSYEVIEQ